MDDVYHMEILRQSLIDACDRENGLSLALQAAREEMEELKRYAIVTKIRFQELDEALEVEEVKTNAERLARQEAEETTLQHRAEAIKAEQREAIANQHCDAAESEILRLQSELSMERSATAAADLRSCQLRGDLELAELNDEIAYEQLTATKAKVCTLQEYIGVATDRISMLEYQAREFEESSKKEHQRGEEAENALNTIAYELENNKIKLSDTLQKYNDLETKHIKCNPAKSVAARAFNTETVDVDKHSHINLENKDSSSSINELGQVLEIDRSMEERMIVKAPLRTAKNQTIIATEMPVLPEPTILRPALASVAACQVEVFKATGRILPAPRANLKNPLWTYIWRLPSNSLHLLSRGSNRP